MTISSSTTSATRSSRRVWEARSTAEVAAFSQDSVLVPINSITLYTLSIMVCAPFLCWFINTIQYFQPQCNRYELVSANLNRFHPHIERHPALAEYP